MIYNVPKIHDLILHDSFAIILEVPLQLFRLLRKWWEKQYIPKERRGNHVYKYFAHPPLNQFHTNSIRRLTICLTPKLTSKLTSILTSKLTPKS